MKPENLRDLPDRILVDRFRTRAEDRFFEEFVRRYATRLYGVCWHILRNRQDSEDVVQEAFLRAYYGMKDYQGGDLFSWLKAIATNCAVNLWRKRKRERDAIVSENEMGPGEFPGRPSGRDMEQIVCFADQIEAELKEVSQGQATVLKLWIQGYTYEEIADETGWTLMTVKSNIQNGILRLRRRWHQVKIVMNKSDAEAE